MASDNKQRLKPWLVDKLNKNSIPGLEWMGNENEEIDRVKFRILWKHGGKHDWTKDMGLVFKEWAVQTGKYREGVDQESYAKWKTNLRCAMNKSQEIHECKEESNTNNESPYKVFRFVNRKLKEESHPIHKREYTSPTAVYTVKSELKENEHLPRSVADYSSASLSTSGSSYGNSLPKRANNSGRSQTSASSSNHSSPSPTQDGGTSQASNMYGSAPTSQMEPGTQSFDSGLMKLDSGALQELKMTSLEREQAMADVRGEESMDCGETGDVPQSAYLDVARPQDGDVRSPEVAAGSTDSSRRSSSNCPTFSPGSAASPLSFGHPATPSPGYSAAPNSQPPAMSPAHNHIQYGQAQDLSNGINNYGLTQDSGNNRVNNGFYCNSVAPSPGFSNNPSSVQSEAVAPSPGCEVTSPLSVASTINPAAHSPGFLDPTSPYPAATQGHQMAQACMPMSGVTSPGGVLDGAPGSCLDGLPDTAMLQSMAGLGVADPAMPPIDENIRSNHVCVKDDGCVMLVELFYQGQVLAAYHVEIPAGCLISSKPLTPNQSQFLDECNLRVIREAIFGDQMDHQFVISLPPWPGVNNARVDAEMRKVLDSMSRGLAITCRDGDIFVTRRCQTSIYWASWFTKCQKLARCEGEQMLFACYQHFVPALDQFCQTNERCPDPCVYLFVGQKGTPETFRSCYITVRVSSCRASNYHQKVLQNSLRSVEVSATDSLDRLDKEIRPMMDLNVGTVGP